MNVSRHESFTSEFLPLILSVIKYSCRPNLWWVYSVQKYGTDIFQRICTCKETSSSFNIVTKMVSI